MDAIDWRAQRGLAIARSKGSKIKTVFADRYVVPSQQGAGSYFVDLSAGIDNGTCSCPDFGERRQRCKHVYAVLILSRQIVVDGADMSDDRQDGRNDGEDKPRIVYPQHPMYRHALRHEKEVFLRFLAALCTLVPEPTYAGTGRPHARLADVVFAGALKAFTLFSTNRAESDLRFAQQLGYVRSVPAPNTILETLRRPEVIEVILRLVETSALPMRVIEMDFAPDGTGIATRQYLRWLDHKTGRTSKLNMFLKLHLMIGVITQIATSARVTPGEWNESPQLKPLVEATSRNFVMRAVSCDAGYASRANHHVIVDANATPYIMFASHHGANSHDPLWNKCYGLFAMHSQEWRDWYHQRSQVESTFSSMKRVLSSTVRATSYNGQVAEILLRVLAHNVRTLVHAMFELGIEPSFWAPTTTTPSVLQ